MVGLASVQGYLRLVDTKDIETAQFMQPHADVRTTLFCCEMLHSPHVHIILFLYLSYLGIVCDYEIRLFAFKERKKPFFVCAPHRDNIILYADGRTHQACTIMPSGKYKY